MKIYKIQQNGYFGGEEEIPDDSKGIPLWSTLDPVPELSVGEYAYWTGSGWVVINYPYVEPVIEPDPVPVDPPVV